MTPYTATDLVRSMNHAYGDSLSAPRQLNRPQRSRRLITWARTFLHLA
jgi:hypothetical protein